MADSKKYGRTANLYDKDNDFYSELAALNIQSSVWISYPNSASVKIPCEGGKTYTISVSTSLPIFRIAESDNANILPISAGSPVDIVANLTDATEYTFTTKSTTQVIIFQGSFSLRETWKNSLMFNEGSTALPYQPYLDWKHSLRKLGTATDTLTSLPVTLYADGNNATVGLVGNMQQSGTPTPQNPIQPSETGERTGNLWNEEYVGITESSVTYVPILVGSGFFTLSSTCLSTPNGSSLFILSGAVSSGASSMNNGVWDGQTRTVESVDDYITIGYRGNNVTYTDPRAYTTMLNTGSTALSYEPYGYKIPIISGGVITNIYIGDAPLRKSLDGSNVYDTIESDGTLTRRVDANGDALATPIVEQITVPPIPTLSTADTFDVLTSLKPSAVYLAYTGWHDATVKEWDGSQWQ